MANKSAALKIVDKRHSAPAVHTTPKTKAIYRVEVKKPAPGTKPRDLAYDDELDMKLTPAQEAELAEFERREQVESRDPRMEDMHAELKESNTDSVERYRWDNQEELGEAHEAERMGKAMHANELMQGLKACGLECGLRKTKQPQMMGLDGVVKINGVMQVTYLCWVQVPWMPEYSVMYFDEHKLPTSEKYRGWRTVLTQLIQQGAITEADAKRVFGEPTGHMVSRRFKQQMYAIRNG